MAVAPLKGRAGHLMPDVGGFSAQPIVVLPQPSTRLEILAPMAELETEARCHGNCWQSLRLLGRAGHLGGLRPDHDQLTYSARSTSCPCCGARHAGLGPSSMTMIGADVG
jgi:hypothetical protein